LLALDVEWVAYVLPVPTCLGIAGFKSFVQRESDCEKERKEEEEELFWVHLGFLVWGETEGAERKRTERRRRKENYIKYEN